MFVRNKNSAFLGLLLLLLTLIACSPDSTEGEPVTEVPTPEPTEVVPKADPFDLSGVYLNDMAVNVDGSEISVTIHGEVLSGCHTFKEVVSRHTETGWEIGVDNSLTGQVCTDAKVHFEGTVVLTEESLPAGAYTIQAGSKTASLNIDESGSVADVDSSIILGSAEEIIITLERTPCFGFCPTYTVEIREDGSITYNGIDNVDMIGEQTGQISTEEMGSLLQAFYNVGYFELADEYTERYVSDMPSTITSIMVDGMKKRIDRYGGDDNAPVALQELEILIDTLVNTEQWTGAQPPEVMVVGGPPPFIEGMEKRLFVGPEQVDCEGVAPQSCLLVKETLEEDWSFFYEQIMGFEYEAGYEYELLVLEIPVENPPANGSSLSYQLLEVVSKVAES